MGTRAALPQGMTTKLMTILLGASLIGGCATPSGTGTAVGAGGGALIGGVAGGWTGALVGAAVGGLLGYGVGRSVEVENERRWAYAMNSNQPVAWTDPQTGYLYRVQPTGTYYSYGRPCRNFRVIGNLDQYHEVYGTACQNPDGSWQVVSTSG